MSTPILHSAPVFGFKAPLFSSTGMVLQRDSVATALWGEGAAAKDKITVTVKASTGVTLASTTALAATDGTWSITIGKAIPAMFGTTVCATVGTTGPSACLENVDWGDVLLCGGQVR